MVRISLVAVLWSSFWMAEASAQRGRSSRSSKPVELEHFEYQRVTFDAPSLESLGGEAGVYLPKGYNSEEASERTYPWILWLHGMNEDADRFYYEGGAAILDQLRGEGKVPELILVAPSAPRRTIYANGEQDGDVEDYVLENVLPYVEDEYRVSSDRQLFALMGVSMGGMGALRMALKDPDRFGTVAVHSAAACPADPGKMEGRAGERVRRTIQWLGLGDLLGDPIDPQKWAQYIPAAMMESIETEDLADLRIYFDAGSADRYGFGPPNQDFHELLKKRGVEHSFTLVKDGGHSWGSGSLQKQLVTSLQFVAAGFAGPKAPAASQ
jgi:enterochelin esterase-like enzyme